MSLEKSATGWLVDEQPGGRGGKRFRETFKTKAQAESSLQHFVIPHCISNQQLTTIYTS